MTNSHTMTTPSWEDELESALIWVNPDDREVTRDRFQTLITLVESRAREEEKQRVVEIVEGMTKIQCNCEGEDGLGYHTKDCTFFPQGYNAALTDLIERIKSDPNSK